MAKAAFPIQWQQKDAAARLPRAAQAVQGREPERSRGDGNAEDAAEQGLRWGFGGDGGIQCPGRAVLRLPWAHEGQGGTQLPFFASAAATSPSPLPWGHTLRGAANWDVNKRPIPISSTKPRSRSCPLLQGCIGRNMNTVSLHRHLVNNPYHFSSNNSSISV